MKLTRREIQEALRILEDEAVNMHPESRQYCYHREEELLNDLRELDAREGHQTFDD